MEKPSPQNSPRGAAAARGHRSPQLIRPGAGGSSLWRMQQATPAVLIHSMNLAPASQWNNLSTITASFDGHRARFLMCGTSGTPWFYGFVLFKIQKCWQIIEGVFLALLPKLSQLDQGKVSTGKPANTLCGCRESLENTFTSIGEVSFVSTT